MLAHTGTRISVPLVVDLTSEGVASNLSNLSKFGAPCLQCNLLSLRYILPTGQGPWIEPTTTRLYPDLSTGVTLFSQCC